MVIFIMLDFSPKYLGERVQKFECSFSQDVIRALTIPSTYPFSLRSLAILSYPTRLFRGIDIGALLICDVRPYTSSFGDPFVTL